jgi:hypothetical protein
MKMLDGTDLFSAFQPLGGQQNDPYANLYSPVEEKKIEPKEAKLMDARPDLRGESKQDDMRVMYDANNMNKQYETEQRLNNILADIKKKKAEPAADNSPGYFDKLFSKKKELFKILQLALIITLGLSLHYLFDYYLKNYLQDNDMSFERQMLLRFLYPVGILFVLWNLKVFIK